MEDINRFLNNFSKFNSDEYVMNYYEFVILASNKDEDIKNLFEKFPDVYKVELIKLNKWKEAFLRQYPSSEIYWFGKFPEGYELNGLTPKQYLIELLLEEFKQEPDEVYLVQVEPNGYYACSSEEYIFKTEKGIYLLSLQVHD